MAFFICGAFGRAVGVGECDPNEEKLGQKEMGKVFFLATLRAQNLHQGNFPQLQITQVEMLKGRGGRFPATNTV